MPANGDRWDGLDRREVFGCLACSTTGLMTKALADDLVEASQGVLEGYPCPNGQGWHVRVKPTITPQEPQEPPGGEPGA